MYGDGKIKEGEREAEAEAREEEDRTGTRTGIVSSVKRIPSKRLLFITEPNPDVFGNSTYTMYTHQNKNKKNAAEQEEEEEQEEWVFRSKYLI